MGRAGIFGWSYPPGCSGPPDCDDEPCVLCGKFDDKCECKPCPTCGDYGCIEHLKDWDIVQRIQLLEFMLHPLQHEADKRKKATHPCPECKAIHVITIFDDCPTYCHGYEWWNEKWQKNEPWEDENV